MKGKWRHSRLFYQYLLSYLCILLLPLLVVSVFVYNYVFNILKDEIQTENIYTLQRARDTLEIQMKHVISLEHSVYLDDVLTQVSLENDTIKAIEIQNELAKYLQTNPFLYDIVYWQEQDNYIITAYSSCLKEQFFERMYRFNNWNYSEFLEDLEQNNNMIFKGTEKVETSRGETKDIITLMRPLKGKSTVRCVLYFIEDTLFTDLMPELEHGEGLTAIIDSNGQTIALNGDRKLLEAFQTEAIHSNESEKSQDYIELLGENYLMTSVFSENYQWSYITLLPGSKITLRMNRVRFLMSMMCLIACSGGLIGVVFFMKHNYMPIQKLELMTSNILNKEKDGNEFDHVAKALDYLKQQNQQLKADANINNDAVRDKFLLKFILGQYGSEEQILSHGRKAGIALDKKIYRVVICQMYQSLPELDQEIENIFDGSAPTNIDVYVRVQPEMKRIILLIGSDVGEENRIEKYLSDTIDIIQVDKKVKGNCGVGSSVKTLIEVSRSYKEAAEALDYHIVLYEQKLIHYEEIALRSGGSFSIQPIELAAFIKNKNIVGFEGFLGSVLNELKWKKADIKSIRMQCNDLIYALEKVINDLNRDYFMDSPLYYDVSNVMWYENCLELMEIIRLIGCDIIDHLNTLSGQSLVETLVLYVKDNCFSTEFSLSAMAEEFKMSTPYLSQYFKNHTGKNLLDYVTDLKIERSKELLACSDFTVKDVAEQVGYNNVNSFNRRFKQITGCTPGEYRKKN